MTSRYEKIFYEAYFPALLEAIKGIHEEFTRYNDMLEKQMSKDGILGVNQNPHNVKIIK